ncbi:MAG: hypothetical protein ACXADB_14845 [Candidatus Hermodarchaeia archaeon]|jgi:hypothetical protein
MPNIDLKKLDNKETPFNDTDKIAFGIAEELGLACEHLAIFSHNDYKFIFVDGSYIAVTIRGSEFIIGQRRECEDNNMSGIFADPKHYDLNNPNLLDQLQNEIRLCEEAHGTVTQIKGSYLPTYPPGSNFGELYQDNKGRFWQLTDKGWRL